MLNFFLSLIVIVVIYGIVINCTVGRITRKTHVLSKLRYIAFYLLLLFLGFICSKLHIYFLLPIVILFAPYVCYKYLQLSIKRLHDLDYSGSYLLLTLIPIISLYYTYLLFFMPSNNELNQYDCSIDYSKFLKSSDIYQTFGLVYNTDNGYVINSQSFTVTQNNSEIIFKCSKTELEEQSSLKDYLFSKFTLIESNVYNDNYFYNIKLGTNGIKQIINDLNALYIENSKLIINDVSVFIRDEDFKYGLLFSNKVELPLIKNNYIKKANPYYNHYLLTKDQLIDFIKESRLTTAST